MYVCYRVVVIDFLAPYVAMSNGTLTVRTAEYVDQRPNVIVHYKASFETNDTIGFIGSHLDVYVEVVSCSSLVYYCVCKHTTRNFQVSEGKINVSSNENYTHRMKSWLRAVLLFKLGWDVHIPGDTIELNVSRFDVYIELTSFRNVLRRPPGFVPVLYHA